MHDFEKIALEVEHIARATGIFIRGEVDKIKEDDVESKGLHNFVTYVDKQAEEQIVGKLQSLMPEAGFIVEENTTDKKGVAFNWVVDPLDGTTNFIHGIPVYSVSIALLHKKEVVLGVVYEPNREECFRAVIGRGAFLNGQPIRVSAEGQIRESLVATGFPYYDYSRMQAFLEMFTWCMENTHGLRRLGSAAVDLAYVACGRFEAFYEYGLNAWDVAAGSLIVREAGGNVSDFSGNDDYIFGREIIAANDRVFPTFLEKVRALFGKEKTGQ
jgi:myo-inositol-1(or 4)-monophosphatase